MARKAKTNRVPKTRACGQWTEAAFWGFMRSNLRRAYMKWPPGRQLFIQNRRAYTGLCKRTKWEHQCVGCKLWYTRKQVQADHIVPCGRLKSWDDLPVFTRRLFCEMDGLQILCSEKCHKTKTAKGMNDAAGTI